MLGRQGALGPRTSVYAVPFTPSIQRMRPQPGHPGPSPAQSHSASRAHRHAVGYECHTDTLTRAVWVPGWQDTSGYNEDAAQEDQEGSTGKGTAQA